VSLPPSFFSHIQVISDPQAVKDEAASHDKLIELFERIHCFLHRLESYIRTLLSNEFVELLGKIMAQSLSILALSTKAMTDRRISMFSIFYTLAWLRMVQKRS
jgi:hypothetical protein